MGKILRRLLGIIIICLLFTITYCDCLVVMADTDAEEEFVISQGVLKSYNGKASECTIPSGITEIGPEAFKNSRLVTITIPAEVKRIDRCAFFGSKKLLQVDIRDGVEYIGPSAFGDCISLSTINIPSSVNNLGAGVFSGCTALYDVSLSSQNERYLVSDSVIYDKSMRRLVQYLPGRKATFFEIPSSVEQIDRYAFWGSKLLTDILINDNITEIPDHAFSGCEGLISIFIPENVEYIRNFAFSDCKNLIIAEVLNEEAVVSKTAFSGCPVFNDDKAAADDLSENKALEEKRENISNNSAGSVSANKQAVSDNSVKGSQKADNKKANSSSSNSSAQIKNGSVYIDKLPKTKKQKSPQTGTIIGESKISGQHAFIIPK